MSDELKGVTAILAVPSYGPVDPVLQKHLRIAMMTCANRGLKWVGDASTDKIGWGSARNMTAQSLLDLKGEAQGCMWVDSDIEVPPQAMARLIYSAIEEGADVMSGVYHKKGPPHTPVIYHYDRNLKKFFELDDYLTDLVIMPGGCGFGFVWTSYNIIKRVSEMPDFDKQKGGWFPDTRYEKDGMGEDFAFCYKVHQLGVPIYVDTGVQVGHAGDSKVYWRKDYLKTKEDLKVGVLKPVEEQRWGIE